MWALALGGRGGGAGGGGGTLFASGGGDGALAVWEDCTAADAHGAAEEAEATVLQEQDLANALRVGGGAGVQRVGAGCKPGSASLF